MCIGSQFSSELCPECGAPVTRHPLIDMSVWRPTERRFLEILTKGRLVRKGAAIDFVWGDVVDGPPMTADKILDVAVHHIRRKLRANSLPYKLETVWGEGWRLRPASAEIAGQDRKAVA